MPSHHAHMKRKTPTDFEESARPVKLLRSDLTPTSVRALKSMAPTSAPVTASFAIEGALKRKHEPLDASEDLTTSKKLRLAATFGVAGTTTTTPSGCRGGKVRSKRARGPNGKFVSRSDEATTGNTSSPSAAEDTAEVSASTGGDVAVKASEDVVKAESACGDVSTEATTGRIISSSTGEDAAEVPSTTKQDAAATTSELADELFDALVGKDTEVLSTPTEGDAAAATECATKAEDDSNTSGKPMSSSRKSVSGSIKSADSSSSSSSSEPASSSQKSANRSNETLDTILSSPEPEEAPEKTTKIAVKKERYITGLHNHGNQCFANATLQFFDAAMDGHDLDHVLGKDASIETFPSPNFTSEDKEKAADKVALERGKTPRTRVGQFKAVLRGGIKMLRSSGRLEDISARKHLRALLSRMRGSKDTEQPEAVTPIVLNQILAFGGAVESEFNYLDGTTQQDCFEYFHALMSEATRTTIEESDATLEEGAKNAATLKSLFAIKSEEGKVCSNPACDYKGTVEVKNDDTISTSVWDTKETLELQDILDVSSTSIVEGLKCSECGEETIANVTKLTEASDNLVVHINRVEASGSGRKLETQVELPLQPITICGKKFVLNAVVRHRGSTVYEGHYTVFRRRSPEWMTDEKSLWYLIDDSDIESIKTSDVRDGWRRAHSAMLLFKAL